MNQFYSNFIERDSSFKIHFEKPVSANCATSFKLTTHKAPILNMLAGLLCIVLLCCFPAVSYSFNHPGGMHTQAQINATHNQAAYNAMMVFANAALSHTHSAAANFNSENPDLETGLARDARDAYVCALAYSINKDPKYAQRALYFMMSWANVNTSYSGNSADLFMAYKGSAMVIAADMMLAYGSWTSTDRTKFKTWVKNVYYKASDYIHTRPNNWGDWGTYGCVLSSYLLDETTAFNTYAARVKYNIDHRIENDGTMPSELARGEKALSYVYFSLAPMTAASFVVYNVTGENLFTYNNSRIKTAIDWWLPYALNPTSYPGIQPQLNPNSPGGRGGNLIEAMWYVYKDNDYNAWVQPARPVQHFGYGDAHHFAWCVPTLIPPAIGSTGGGTTYTVDNTDAGFSTTGTWTVSTSSSQRYGINYLHDGDALASPGDGAKWMSPITTTGRYDVYMIWAAQTDRPVDAPVEINYDGGVFNRVVNQRLNGGTWYKLGTWQFTGGSGDYVSISGSASGNTIADAVRWVPEGGAVGIAAQESSPALELSQKAPETLSIYPNPVSSVAKLTFDSQIAGKASVTAYNQLGQTVYKTTSTIAVGKNELEIDVRSFPSGICIVKVLVNNTTLFTSKLLKD